MNLAIDIGNTRIKTGRFDGERLLAQQTWENWTAAQLCDWVTNQNAQNVILSTVAGPTDPAVLECLQAFDHFLELGPATPLPIVNRYRTPETLGKDRLAAVVGAFQQFPNAHCLVIDAGTCITYDLLDDAGIYPGGNIAPGIAMRLRAMHAFTARLPAVQPAGDDEGWLGDTTETAMRRGAQMGAALEIEGYIALCRSRIGRINVILTGGDADFLAKKLKSKIFVNHHLVLMGLNKILNYNVEGLE
jgi:type III pantothenate kinase